MTTQEKGICENILKFMRDQSDQITKLKEELKVINILPNRKAANTDKLCAICSMTNSKSFQWQIFKGL